MTAPALDKTAHPVSLYVSERVAAAMLGRSLDWMKEHRDDLETAGFPKVDPITRLRPREAIEEWVRARWRKKLAPAILEPSEQERENLDAL